MPFSKRPDASVLWLSFLEPALTQSPLKLADSTSTMVVSLSISESRPPMMPAMPKGLSASLIIRMELSSCLSTPSRVVNLSPSFAVSTMIFPPFTVLMS